MSVSLTPCLPPEADAEGRTAHLPVFLSTAGRIAVLVGGGPLAAIKAAALKRCGLSLRVVADAVCPDLARLEPFQHIPGPLALDHLSDALLLLDASGEEDTNAHSRALASAARLPLNVVDRPALCDFIMPAVLERGPVTVAIGTGGLAPALARIIRQRLETAIPPVVGRIARVAARLRDGVKARLPGQDQRLRFWDAALSAEPPPGLDDAGLERALAALLDAHADGAPECPPVKLVGAGPGDPALLTLAAAEAIRSADVILYDHLVGKPILDLARRDAEMICVGKRKADHLMAQGAINDLLVEKGRTGRRVIRLKGGDPFLFGRGGEEMQALRAAGLGCVVVPGVTAALGCGAAAGIPLTHRDHAAGVTFITGHGRNGEPDLDWPSLARLRHTLVVYMGVSACATIAERLQAHGLAGDTPAALVQNGTRPDQILVTGTLAGLAGIAADRGLTGPAIIVIGAVAALADAPARLAAGRAMAEPAVAG